MPLTHQIKNAYAVADRTLLLIDALEKVAQEYGDTHISQQAFRTLLKKQLPAKGELYFNGYQELVWITHDTERAILNIKSCVFCDYFGKLYLFKANTLSYCKTIREGWQAVKSLPLTDVLEIVVQYEKVCDKITALPEPYKKLFRAAMGGD